MSHPAPVLAYSIGDSGITWEEGEVSNLDADALLRPSAPADRENQTNAAKLIREWLDDEHTTWPMDAKHALEAGGAYGIPDRTMRWTASRLGIRPVKEGFGRASKWVWPKPSSIAPVVRSDDAHRGNDSDLSNTQHVAPIAPMQDVSVIPADPRTKQNKGAIKSAFSRAREDATVDCTDEMAKDDDADRF